MTDCVQALRDACTEVAARARQVRIEEAEIPAYANGLGFESPSADRADPDQHLLHGTREERAAFWLTLDAINFGSGWFPTLRKRPGTSGYGTVAAGIRDRFKSGG